MIDKKRRMEQLLDKLLDKLRDAFGDRLLYVGLQGSYARGEETPASDFDAVVILDRVGPADLRLYRTLLDGLPDRDKACGFIGGRRELWNWPRHELFQFGQDTHDYHGRLADFLPPVTDADIRASIANTAAATYHGLCHTYIHADRNDWPAILKGAYKGAFFALVAAHYLRHGEYVGGRKALLDRLEGREREILAAGMDWRDETAATDPDRYFALLLEWCGDILAESADHDC